MFCYLSKAYAGGSLLLQASRLSLLSIVAEGLVKLLYPFRFQHVYIPIVPSSMTEYLEVGATF